MKSKSNLPNVYDRNYSKDHIHVLTGTLFLQEGEIWGGDFEGNVNVCLRGKKLHRAGARGVAPTRS